MSLEIWLAYLATIAVVIICPGPSVLLSAAHGMVHGLPRTFGTIAGDLSANAIQMIAASLGVGAVLMASGNACIVLKGLGATYLLYLGVKRWVGSPVQIIHPANPSRERSVSSLYRQGFLVSALNPKAVLFFVAIFPQFVDPLGSRFIQFKILGITFLVMDAGTLTLYARFSQRMHEWLSVHSNRTRLNRITGSLLILAAVIFIS